MTGLTRALLPAHTTVGGADSFTAAAVGNADADATLDVWTIDDGKQLQNLVNDCDE